MVDLTDLKQSRSGLRTRSAANLFQRTTVMGKNVLIITDSRVNL